MVNKRYKPKLDKLFFILFIPTNILIFAVVIILSFFHIQTLFLTVPIMLFISYFFVSPLFGYVELQENKMVVKYGFFLKRQIDYRKIRSVEKQRKFYSDSMLSLKNSFEHVNIKYNTLDVTTISVLDNDTFIADLDKRRLSE